MIIGGLALPEGSGRPFEETFEWATRRGREHVTTSTEPGSPNAKAWKLQRAVLSDPPQAACLKGWPPRQKTWGRSRRY